MLLYALLYLTGYDLTLDDLKPFRQLGSKTPGIPKPNARPASKRRPARSAKASATRSAWRSPKRICGAVYNRADRAIVDHFTYCICGDGDLMEGISQEAVSLAGHLKLGKLIVLYDDNHVSLAGPDRHHAHRRSGRALRRERLAHAVRRRRPRQRRRDDRSSDHGREERHRPAVAHRGAHAHRLRLAAPRQLSRRTAKRSDPRTSRKSKEELGWPLEPDFYVPDDVLAFYREHRREGRRARSPVASDLRRVEDRQRRSRRAARTRAARRASGRSAVADVRRRERQRRDARRRRYGDERHRAEPARTRRRFGRSRSLDEDLPERLRRFRAQQLRRAQHPLRRARARHGGLQQRHRAARRAAAVRRDLLQLRRLLQAGVAPGCSDAASTRSSSSRTIRSFSAKTARRTSRSNSSRRCARRRTATSCARPTRSRRSRPGSSRWPRKGAPWVLVLTRQKLPFLGARDAAVGQGAYVSADADGGTPDLILIATGSEVSLAVDAEEDSRREGRADARRLDAVLGALRRRSRKRIATRCFRRRSPRACRSKPARRWAGRKYVGDRGFAFGIDHFGASAPAADDREGLRLHAGERRRPRPRTFALAARLGETRE